MHAPASELSNGSLLMVVVLWQLSNGRVFITHPSENEMNQPNSSSLCKEKAKCSGWLTIDAIAGAVLSQTALDHDGTLGVA